MSLWSSQSLSRFIMIFIWVHHTWMYDEFLGSSDACQMNLWALSMSSVFGTYFRMLLDNTFVRWIYGICLGMCAWERKVDLHLHAHALRDCVVHVLYQLPYMSNSNWMRQDLLFAFAFHFSHFKEFADVNILNIRMFLLFHLGWIVRLPFDIIKS